MYRMKAGTENHCKGKMMQKGKRHASSSSGLLVLYTHGVEAEWGVFSKRSIRKTRPEKAREWIHEKFTKHPKKDVTRAIIVSNKDIPIIERGQKRTSHETVHHVVSKFISLKYKTLEETRLKLCCWICDYVFVMTLKSEEHECERQSPLHKWGCTDSLNNPNKTIDRKYTWQGEHTLPVPYLMERKTKKHKQLFQPG